MGVCLKCTHHNIDHTNVPLDLNRHPNQDDDRNSSGYPIIHPDRPLQGSIMG